MKNLWLRDGCHNCQHVFVLHEYDCGPELFCNVDNNRPLCGSVAMGEMFPSILDTDAGADERWLKHMDAWDEWSNPRNVLPANICDLFIPKKGEG